YSGTLYERFWDAILPNYGKSRCGGTLCQQSGKKGFLWNRRHATAHYERKQHVCFGPDKGASGRAYQRYPKPGLFGSFGDAGGFWIFSQKRGSVLGQSLFGLRLRILFL